MEPPALVYEISGRVDLHSNQVEKFYLTYNAWMDILGAKHLQETYDRKDLDGKIIIFSFITEKSVAEAFKKCLFALYGVEGVYAYYWNERLVVAEIIQDDCDEDHED